MNPREHAPPQATPSKPALHGPKRGEEDCLDCARQLQKTLREEAQALKRFAGPELLPIITRKEFLVDELGRELERVAGGRGKISGPLRDVLASIDDLNRSNRLFIQSSLAHWRELLSLLCPVGYGPGAEVQKGGMPAPKGLSFSREI